MSRSTRPRRRAAAALVTAAVAAVIGLGGASAAQADTYHTPWGPQQVGGAILGTHKALGGPGSALGLPVTSERGTPHGIGRFNLFNRGGIYWTPRTGAHSI